MTRGRAYIVERLRKHGLSKRQARRVLDELVEAMKEALRNGEGVDLPIGTLEVVRHKRKPQRGFYLNRISTTYKKPFTVVLREGITSANSRREARRRQDLQEPVRRTCESRED